MKTMQHFSWNSLGLPILSEFYERLKTGYYEIIG